MKNPKDRQQTIPNVSRLHAGARADGAVDHRGFAYFHMALTGMGVLPQFVVALMLAFHVISILVVTSRAYHVSAPVAVAFVRSDQPSLLTDLLSQPRILHRPAPSSDIARATGQPRSRALTIIEIALSRCFI
jgi:hypothetical protein